MNAQFVNKNYSAGAPESHSYMDQFGRTLKTSVKDFADGNFISSHTDFDKRGLVTFESQPYSPTELTNIGKHYLAYDVSQSTAISP